MLTWGTWRIIANTNSAMVDENSRPTPKDLSTPSGTPRLMAVVEVDKSERVYCAQPGCHHTVYKAIHVVKEAGQLLVLGSTCFEKRYGSLKALGKAQHWGGKGRLLTSEERALLAENTQALLTRFEAEETRLRVEVEQGLQKLQDEMLRRAKPPQIPTPAPAQIPGMRGMSLRGVFPWPWMMPSSSVAAFKLRTAAAGCGFNTKTAGNSSFPGLVSMVGKSHSHPWWGVPIWRSEATKLLGRW